MLNRLIRTASLSVRQLSYNISAQALIARNASSISGIDNTGRFGRKFGKLGKLPADTQNAMLLLTVSALIVLGIMLLYPNLVDRLGRNPPSVIGAEPTLPDQVASSNNSSALAGQVFTQGQAIVTVDSQAMPTANSPVTRTPAIRRVALARGDADAATSNRQQRWVTYWLAKRYRVAEDATDLLVTTAYLTAKDIKLDPLLILAVMAIESGLNPFAESPLGAQGLMQIMSKVHRHRFQDLGGVKEALNPVANIRVGASILKEYVQRGGSVEAGLKSYVGAGAFDSDSGYGTRVMAEYGRLKQVATGKHVPITPPTALASQKPRSADKLEEPIGPVPNAKSADVNKGEQVAALF